MKVKRPYRMIIRSGSQGEASRSNGEKNGSLKTDNPLHSGEMLRMIESKADATAASDWMQKLYDSQANPKSLYGFMKSNGNI